jgi:ATP-dependent Lon protease
MNPIIYIDELDKVSKTEQGREIIGILTHMIDYTQNDEFQDKYFSGVPVDLSKALFIFSYNDPEQIDRILLDRIHRIKFDNLSADDKHVIVNNFILPEINRKMGFENIVELPKETIDYIIEFYTMESGIRKLKEILFDLYGEINIELLQSGGDNASNITIPICVNVEDLGKKYLKKYKRIHEKLIHSDSKAGVINGLWANALGKGGIIPIETSFFPSSTFLDLKLTGLQGDVMKESMNIAKTLAWTLTPDETKKALMEKFESTKNQGLHIHCPEGAVSKDGPSAGGAITLSIYSLFNNIKISNTVAITGEINLQGNITAIGGLDIKIMGGIRAGVKTFMYPKDNQQDFDDCYAKHKDFFEDRGIKFHCVSQIQDVFQYVYV